MTRLETVLAKKYGIETSYIDDEKFWKLIKKEKSHRFSPIRKYYKEVEAARKLRNVKTHFNGKNGTEIFEVSKEFVKFIEEKIIKPYEKEQRISTFLKSSSVMSLSSMDSVKTLLGEIRTKNYSQFPIFDEHEKFMGVISDNGIANWLAQQDSISHDVFNAKIEVLLAKEEEQRYAVVSTDDLVLTVLEKFDLPSLPLCVLVVEKGAKKRDFTRKQLKHIVTRYDIPNLQDFLNI
jgi:predicted transcriptional regulator